MATVTVNTLEFVSALRALIPISKQATLYSGEKERNAATIAARITPAKKLALITGNSALGAIASVGIEQAVEAGERPHAAKQIIEALEEANKERTKQISALIDTLQETVEAMPEDANQQGVMDAIETLKGFLGWAL